MQLRNGYIELSLLQCIVVSDCLESFPAGVRVGTFQAQFVPNLVGEQFAPLSKCIIPQKCFSDSQFDSLFLFNTCRVQS